MRHAPQTSIYTFPAPASQLLLTRSQSSFLPKTRILQLMYCGVVTKVPLELIMAAASFFVFRP